MMASQSSGWAAVRDRAGAFPWLVLTLLVAYALKSYYRAASAEDLRWILAPTAYLVGAIGNQSFHWESGVGAVNLNFGIAIVAGCAGMNFLIVTMCALSFAFVRRHRTHAGRAAWLLASMAIAYAATVMINAARILCTIARQTAGLHLGLSSQDAHRFEGIVVYFLGLLAVLALVDRIAHEKSYFGRAAGVGLGCYLAVTLAVPLVRSGAGDGYAEHAAWVLASACTLTAIALVAATTLSGRRSRDLPRGERHDAPEPMRG